MTVGPPSSGRVSSSQSPAQETTPREAAACLTKEAKSSAEVLLGERLTPRSGPDDVVGVPVAVVVAGAVAGLVVDGEAGAVVLDAAQPESARTATRRTTAKVRMGSRGGGHMNRSNRSFFALQMGQTPGGPSRAQR